MATYEVDGVRYSIDDGVDIHRAVAGIRQSKSHQDSVWKLQTTPQSFMSGVGENAAGAATGVADLALGAPGFVASVPYGVGEAANAIFGSGSFKRTKEVMEAVQEYLTPDTPSLDPYRDTGGHKAVMAIPEAIMETPGKLGGALAYYLGGSPETIEEVGSAGDVAAMILGGYGLARSWGRAATRAKEAVAAHRKAAEEAEAKAAGEAKLKELVEKAKREAEALEKAAQRPAPPTKKFRQLIEKAEREVRPPNVPSEIYRTIEQAARDSGLEATIRPRIEETGPGREISEAADLAARNARVQAEIERSVQENMVPFEREPGTGIYDRGPLTPESLKRENLRVTEQGIEKTQRPPMRPEELTGPDRPTERLPQGGVDYVPVTDGISRLLEQKKAAEAERAFQARDAETRSGLTREAEIARAYEERTPEQPGLTFLERLEQDLTNPRGPKRTGPFSGEVKLGIGIDAVEWARKYGPIITDWARKNNIPDLVFQGIPKGVDPNKPSYWFTTSLAEAAMWAGRNGEGGRIAVARASDIKGHRTKSERNDFPDSEHIYAGDTKSRPVLKEWSLEPIVQDTLRGDPGKKQGGGWTPFASSKTKAEPTYSDFLKELEHAKLGHLPDSIKQKLWDERTGVKPTKTSEEVRNPTKRTEEVVKDTVGLDKETRELYYDRRADTDLARDLETLWAEKGSKGDILHDASASPNAYRARKHTLTRYVNSKINEAFDASAKAMAAMRIGTKTTKAGKRVVDPDSPQGVWNALKKEERITVNDAAHAMMKERFVGEITPEALRKYYGREPTPREVRAHQAMAKIGRYALERVENPWRREHGMPEIPPDTFYWGPALWPGDYIYFVRDKNGVLIEPVGTYLRPDSRLGRMFNKKLKQRLKELDIEFDPKAWRRHATADSMTLAGMEVLYDHYGRMKDTKTGQVRTLVEELQKEFSVRKARSQYREGYPGYMGSEGGAKGVKSQEKVWNRYVQQIINAEATMKLAALGREIGTMKAAGKFPKAQRAALAHIDRAMGKQSKGFAWLDSKIADGLDALGLPPNTFARGVDVANGIAIRWAIGFNNLAQAAIQPFQVGFALVKALDTYTNNLKMGGKPVPPALAQFAAPALIIKPALQMALDTIFRNNKYMRDLGLEGTFSPSMKHEYTGFSEVSFGEKATHKVGKGVIGDTLQQFSEANMVRSPSARFFHNVLDDLGIKGEARTRITKGLTDDYMVAFDQHKKSGLIGNTGTTGRFFGSLQSFTTTYLGQLLEYSTKALTRGQVVALGGFLAYGYLIAGLLGQVYTVVADEGITLINKMLGTKYRTYTEWVLEEKKADSVRYGVPAAMTGTGINVKLAAPTFVNQQGPPSASWTVATIKLLGVIGKWALWKSGIRDETNKPSREEWGKAWGDWTPASGRGVIEDEYKTKSGVILDRKGQFTIKRTPFDQAMRYLSLYSLREITAKRNPYLLKKEQSELNERRSAFTERLALRLLDEEGNISPAFMTKARELQFTSSELRRALAASIKEKVLAPELRAYGRVTTPRAARAYQYYQRLLSEDDKERARATR